MKSLSRLTFKYLKQNFARTITTIVGVFISAIIIYIVFAGGYSAYDSVSRNEYNETMGWDAVYVVDVKTADELTKLAPYYKQTSDVDDSDFKLSHGFYTAYTEHTYNCYINDFDAMPVAFNMKYGELPSNSNEVIYSYEYALYDKVQLGETFTEEVMIIDDDGNVHSGEYEVIVSGIYESDFQSYSGDGKIVLDTFATYAELSDATKADILGDVYFYATFEDKNNLYNQAEALADAYGIEEFYINEVAIDCYAVKNDNNSLSFLCVQALLLILAAVGAIAALFIVRNAFNISIHERNNDYGILRCIGMERKQIVKIIILESLIVSAVGIFLGIIFGHILTVIGFKIIKVKLGMGAFFKARIYVKAILLTILYSLVTVAYAMVAPIEKLYKVNPIESFRKTDEFKEKKLKPKRGRLLTKIFGFEVGYAYKSVLRRKGRFLVTVATLTIGTMVFVSLNTGLKNITKFFDENVYNVGNMDGAFEVSSYEEVISIRKSLMAKDMLISSKTNNIMYALHHKGTQDDMDNYRVEYCHTYIGFEEEEFEDLINVSNMLEPSNDPAVINIILYDSLSDEETTLSLGDTLIIKGETRDYELYVYGVIEESDFSTYLDINTELYSDMYIIEDIYMYQLGHNLDYFEMCEEGYDIISQEFSLLVDLKNDISDEKIEELVFSLNAYYSDYTAGYKIIQNSFNAIKYIASFGIILLLAVFVTNIINVNRADLYLRRDEFEIMRYIGMSKKQKSKIILSESLITSIIAIFLGSIIGSPIGMLTARSMFYMDEEAKFDLFIDWSSIIICAVVLIIFAFITAKLSTEKE